MKSRIKKILKRNDLIFYSVRFIYLFLKQLGAFLQQLGAKYKWRALREKEEIKLELGSGRKRGEGGWVTVDITSGADINWDLRKGIPLPNDSVDKMYSSHLLEHIPYQQLIPFLRECRRALRSDGEFLVCVPNARLYIDGYISGELFCSKEMWSQQALVETGSKIDQLNYMAYMNDKHKYMFDEENLVNTLLTAGFASAELRQFDPSVDLKERDFESIYAVAKK